MNRHHAPGSPLRRQAVLEILGGWLVVALLAVLPDWPAILAMRLADPDDALRLVQVRALLAGQGWFDLHQYRVDPPLGVIMHWSRLVDLPLAGMIMALRPLLGTAGAELAAAVLVPLLTLLAAQLCLGRLAWRRLGPGYVLLSALLMVLMLPAMMQFKPLRIDHHGWQIVAVVAALNALLSPDSRRGPWIAGAALAFGLSVSLELLPFAGLFAAVFGLRWLGDPAQRQWLVRYLDALTLCSGALFLATRGLADLTAYCDAVSPAYLGGLVAMALVVRGVAAVPTVPRAGLLAMFAVAGLFGAATFLWLAPACTTGPFARLDPLVRDFWYNNVNEGMPIWRQDFAVMVQMLLPPLIGLQAAVRLARDERSRFWGEYALLLGGAIAISIAVSRFSGVSSAIAVVPLAWQLRAWAGLIPRLRSTPGKAALAVAMGLAFMPGLAVQGAGKVYARIAAKPQAASGTAMLASNACSMPQSLAALARLPQGTILAPLDVGPHILLVTPHSVVATGHHRASAAMHDVLAAFLGNPETARRTVLRHRVDYVLLCGDLVEAQMYRQRAPHGLAAQLLAGRTVAWLSPVDFGPGAGAMKLWRVAR